MDCKIRSAAAAAVAACVAASALGGDSTTHYVPCGNSEHETVGSFYATVTYSHTGGSNASVSILMENTTAAGLGGYITGLALNGGAGVTGMSFTSCTMASFAGLAGPVSAPPFGSFVTGASIGHSWLGGGDPSAGIGVGGSATFVFGMSGSEAALSALTAEDVFGTDGPFMAVRFRGGSPDDWSDKVLGCPTPAPGALSLLAFCGLVASRRRR